MKFASILRDEANVLPDTEDLFKKYKHLKKSLKRMSGQDNVSLGVDNISMLSDSAPKSVVDLTTHEDVVREYVTMDRRNQEAQVKEKGKLEPGEEGQHATVGEGKKRCREEESLNMSASPPKEEKGKGEARNASNLEAEFMVAITSDVMDLNQTYIEKEEDFVIAWGNIEEKMKEANTDEEKMRICSEIIDFHGQLVMLLHWSMLAYTGLVKILKKHHKRTGMPLHAPHLRDLLHQPFCSVGMACDMVRKAEQVASTLSESLGLHPPEPANLDTLVIKNDGTDVQKTLEVAECDSSSDEQVLEKKDIPAQHASAIERAQIALNTWENLQRNAATPSTGIAQNEKDGQKKREQMTDSSVA
eukprot:jgi/Picsp_1/1459/NSC_04938-R1_ids4-like protein